MPQDTGIAPANDALVETGEALTVIDFAPPGPSAPAQGILDGFRAWVEEPREPPSAEDLAEVIGRMVAAGATDLDRHGAADALVGALCCARMAKGERAELKKAFTRAWREKVRAAKPPAPPRKPEVHAVTETSFSDSVPSAAERAAEREQLWERVKPIAMHANPMELAVDLVERLGVVGERNMVELVYLACTSRVTRKPMSMVAKGSSSSGKSFTTQQTIRLMPPESVIFSTAGSEKWLVYLQRSFCHSIVVFAEASQLQQKGAETYLMMVRELMSSGNLVYHRPIEDKNNGIGTSGTTITRTGPVVAIITTTAHMLDAELETRLASASVNESKEQTRRILDQIALEAEEGVAATDPTDEIELHRDFQRWIGAGPRTVAVPYARALTKYINPIAVRLRRDGSVVMHEIRAQALICQANREINRNGSVIATLDDFTSARPHIVRLLGTTSRKVANPRVATVVTCIQDWLDQTAALPTTTKASTGRPSPGVRVTSGMVHATYQQIADYTGLSKSSVQHALGVALEIGYLSNHAMERQTPLLAIGDVPLPIPGDDDIPTADDL